MLTRDLEQRADVGMPEPQVPRHHREPRSSASGSGPASARGTIAKRITTAAARPSDRAAAQQQPETTGTGEVSAAYGVKAISATSGYGTSTPTFGASAQPPRAPRRPQQPGSAPAPT